MEPSGADQKPIRGSVHAWSRAGVEHGLFVPKPSSRGLPAPQHVWPAADRPCVSAGVHRCRWRLSLTSSFGRSRAGRERLLPPTRFPSLRASVRWRSEVRDLGRLSCVICAERFWT